MKSFKAGDRTLLLRRHLFLKPLPAEDGAAIFTWSSEPNQVLAIFRAKAEPFSQHFLDPGYRSGPRD